MRKVSFFVSNAVVCSLLLGPCTTLSQTWIQANSVPISCVAGSYDGSQLVAGQIIGTLGGIIYLSTNSGSTWFNAGLPPVAWSSVASSSNGTVLAAVGKTQPFRNSLYLSTDGGKTWSENTNRLSSNWQSVTLSSGGTLLAAVGKSYLGPSFICTSTNLGTTLTSNNLPDLGWTSVASDISGNTVIAVGKGAVCTSTNAGLNWVIDTSSITNTLAYIACSGNANLLATLGTGQIFVSTNRGASWALTTAPNLAWSAIATPAEGSQLIATTTNGGIWSSTNSGVTWTSNNAPNAQWTSVTASASGERLVAVGSLGTYRSPPTDLALEDNSAPPFLTPGSAYTFSFKLLNSGPGVAGGVIVSNRLPTGFNFISATPTPATNGSTLLFAIGALPCHSTTNISIQAEATDAGWGTNVVSAIADTPDPDTNNSTLITTTATFVAGARNWKKTSAPVTNWHSVACSADGSKIVAACGLAGVAGPIITSTNWGDTWEVTAAPQLPWSAVASSADGDKLAATTSGGAFYTSADAGRTWTFLPSPGGPWGSIASSADGSKLVACSYGVCTSPDSGVSWNCGPGAYWRSVASSIEGVRLVAGGDSVLFTSPDAGNTWIQATNAPALIWTAVASSADGTRLVAGDGASGNKTSIYTSSNGGLTWVSNSVPYPSSCTLASSADGRKLVAALRNGSTAPIYSSFDYGINWTLSMAPVTHWASVASSADGDTLVAASWTQGIFVSRLPHLEIQRSRTNVLISWPANSIGFTLQSASAPVGANWAMVSNPPPTLTTNLRLQITVPPGIVRGYFRLKGP